MHRIIPGEKGAQKAASENADVVIVDALRASATICALFAAGAMEVYVCAGVPAARKVAEEFANPFLVGEENSIKPEDFAIGNSPVAALEYDLSEKDVIFTSTNGARLLIASRGAARVMIGSVNNVEVVGQAVNTGNAKETIIVPAGDMEAESDEDMASAVLLAEASGPEIAEGQENLINHWLGRIADEGLTGLFENSVHGQELMDLGCHEDVIHASDPDVSKVLPVVAEYQQRNGELVARLIIEG